MDVSYNLRDELIHESCDVAAIAKVALRRPDAGRLPSFLSDSPVLWGGAGRGSAAAPQRGGLRDSWNLGAT